MLPSYTRLNGMVSEWRSQSSAFTAGLTSCWGLDKWAYKRQNQLIMTLTETPPRSRVVCCSVSAESSANLSSASWLESEMVLQSTGQLFGKFGTRFALYPVGVAGRSHQLQVGFGSIHAGSTFSAARPG